MSTGKDCQGRGPKIVVLVVENPIAIGCQSEKAFQIRISIPVVSFSVLYVVCRRSFLLDAHPRPLRHHYRVKDFLTCDRSGYAKT
uniref:Uncharacterized protein n=1 Tax=Utricularia reniformis TaxID=192314 RepID=A0A1Y0AZY2_9LAMI|nr:hypothetical protein AEK19_MT0485 [Utricularia reniformis]ART30742.1 hypothetical protein AEK19_MT0485 [Utricularia reniformis]